MQSASDKTIKGIDVSHWDGNIDYSKVKDQGIEIVYIKATQGEHMIDSKFETNTLKAKEKGLYIGFYHFFTPSTEESAKKQAEHFVNTTKKYNSDCKMALDIEVGGGLSSSKIRKLCKIFLEEVKKLSKLDVVIYSYTSFVKEHFDKSLNVYPLWIAQYGVDKPSNNGIWDTWVGFQYSEKGNVRGINAQCDLDLFANEILLKSKQTPKLEPKSQPKSTPKAIRNSKYITYIVKNGDTLSEIASKYNTSIENIVKLNKIKDPNKIYVGQLLRIK